MISTRRRQVKPLLEKVLFLLLPDTAANFINEKQKRFRMFAKHRRKARKLPEILLLVGIAYSYFLYPAFLWIWRGLRGPKMVRKSPIEPSVTLIIAAYNEEDKIKAKLENSVRIHFPREKLEILVASDASSDATDAIVREFPEVRLCRTPERRGKEHAQKKAITESTGEILVFTDSATLLDPNAIQSLVANFGDPRVGAVSSKDVMLGGGNGSGEGMYVRYEMALRRLESQVHSVVGLSGSFFAARRQVCQNWSEDFPSDFNTVFNCARMGYRAISDEQSLGYYKDIRKGVSEFDRKVRTLLRGMTALFANLSLLNPMRYGVFAFQLFSHKLMRWAVPLFLIELALRTLWRMRRPDNFGIFLFSAQALGYAMAYGGWKREPLRSLPPVKVAHFFTQVNVAIFMALLKYAKGERIRMWNPTQR